MRADVDRLTAKLRRLAHAWNVWFSAKHKLNALQQAVRSGRHEEALRSLRHLAADAATYSVEVNLQLASLATLYRSAGLEFAQRCVEAAEQRQADNQPLYHALKSQLEALGGKPGHSIRNHIDVALASAEPLAIFHAASALLIVGEVRQVARTVSLLDPARLPDHLVWRHWALRGELAVQQHRFEDAVSYFQQAITLAPESDQPLERFSLAECWLHLARPDEALAVLGDKVPPLADCAQQVRGHYLLGVTQRQLGNYDHAFRQLQRAYTIAKAERDVSFELLQELARYYVETSDADKAIEHYEAAITAAPARHKPYIQHEYGRVLKDYEQFDAAQRVLKHVLAQTRYPQRPEVSADLAEVSYYLGKFNRVEPLAQFALRGGVTASACLSLGRVALEYFRLDDAESWLEQVIGASTPGDRYWLTAQLLLAETFAHKVEECPERLKHHAEQALKYLHPNDDWVITLETYLETARQQLDGQTRVVN